MSEVHNKAFYSTALHYQQFEKFMRENSSASKMFTIEQVMAEFPNATYQQVASFMGYMKKKKVIGMLREGQKGAYWWKPNDPKPTQVIHASVPETVEHLHEAAVQPDKCPDVQIASVAQPDTLVADNNVPDNKPEIIVTANKVVVISKNVKITVEL